MAAPAAYSVTVLRIPGAPTRTRTSNYPRAMEPFSIRTIPARLPLFPLVVGAAVAGLAVLLGLLGVRTTTLVVHNPPDDPGALAIRVGLLLFMFGLLWLFVRMYAPIVQVTCMYLFRDRGKQVVAYRLEKAGWRYVIAGADVVIPWEGMSVAVTGRTDDHFHLRVDSPGPFVAARDPLSQHLRRTFRKEGGTEIQMTRTDPTEDELASAIAQQSAGRVALTR